MLCVSLKKKSVEELLASLKKLSFAEIRLDDLFVTPKELRVIFGGKTKTIATCRPEHPGKSGFTRTEDERLELLTNAVLCGANYVDIDLETPEDYKRTLFETAKKNNCFVIMSYHNYEETPSQKELEHIVNKCARFKPDIIKIACLANSPKDPLRILALLHCKQPIIAVSMGTKGKITRLAGPLLGSPFTYVSETKLQATALGQMDLAATKQIFKLMDIFDD